MYELFNAEPGARAILLLANQANCKGIGVGEATLFFGPNSILDSRITTVKPDGTTLVRAPLPLETPVGMGLFAQWLVVEPSGAVESSESVYMRTATL